MDADVIIAGAGPAGLGTALCAARAGLRTLVLEPRVGPIDKACGEGLMPSAVERLRDWGVEPDGVPLRGIRYTDGRRGVDAAFPHGPGLGVRRTALQGALHRAALEAGVRIERGRVAQIEQDADGVTVGGRRARYLVGADGLHSPVRRLVGLERGASASSPRARFGTRQHFAVRPWNDLVEVHWAARSEAYVTPVGRGLVGVAVLSSDRAPFAQQLEEFPALRERLPAAGVTPVRGAGPLRQRTAARRAGRVLLVGDAAGYVDALTGEGIAVALTCAEALVECLVADDPEAYERRWLEVSRDYRRITSALLWARRRAVLGGQVVPLAARWPRVFEAAVGRLA